MATLRTEQPLQEQITRLLIDERLVPGLFELLEAVNYGHPTATRLLGALCLTPGGVPVQIQITVTRREDDFI